MDIFELEQKIMDMNEGKISKEQCTQDAMSMLQLADIAIELYEEKKKDGTLDSFIKECQEESKKISPFTIIDVGF